MRRSYISVYEAGGRLGTYRSALDKIAGFGKFRNQKGQLQKHSILVIKKAGLLFSVELLITFNITNRLGKLRNQKGQLQKHSI